MSRPGRGKPALLVAASVAASSTFPLIIDFVPSGHLGFASGLLIGAGVGAVIYVLFVYRRWIVNSQTVGLLFRRGFAPASGSGPKRWMALGIGAQFSILLVVWSASYVDPGVSAILNSLYVVFFVFGLARYARDEARYQTVTGGQYALLFLAFLGVVLVIWGSTDRTGAVTAVPWQLFGMLLGLISAVLAALSSAGYKWAFAMRRELQGLERIHRIPTVQVETACSLLVYGAGNVVAGMCAFGFALATGDGFNLGLFLWAAVYGGTLFNVSTVLLRKANLLTADLTINNIIYASPPLALVWLGWFSEINVPRVGLVIAGVGAITAANVLLGAGLQQK
jgi:hypothetical protein